MQANSTELINKFNLAYDLSKEGQFKTAFQIWDQLSSLDPASIANLDSNEFMSQVNLYKAWSQADMGEYKNALSTLESMFLKFSIQELSSSLQFDYYFSYGNIAGEALEKEKMESAFVEAIKVSKQNNNTDQITECWLNLLFYAEKNQWWKYLEQAARTCIVFAESSNNISLGLSAGLKRARALLHLGKHKRAEIQSKRIIQVALQFNENEALELAQEFINMLDTKNPGSK